MFSIRPGLESTRELIRRAGHPERDLRFLHIAGTNGKGSTGAMLECALRSAGFTTGFYSSPHLLDVRERFRVNGLAVPESDYDALSSELAALAENGGGEFSYFEFTTVLAMMIFARAGVDVVLWETGMGGRLDATNVVTPLASIITGIALDHQAHLGHTIAAIAAEKAGILKPGVPVYRGELPPEALAVVKKRAAELGCPVSEPEKQENPAVRYGERGGRPCQFFRCAGCDVALPLPGAMQRRNFLLAAAVLRDLAPRLGFDLRTALEGISQVRWPARCQQLTDRLIVDGGHNPDGLAALAEALAETWPGEKFTVVFAAFRDKDAESGLRRLAPAAAAFYCVPLQEPGRAGCSAEELAAMAGRCGVPARTFPSAREAVSAALAGTSGRVLTAGSLYLAGDVLRAFADRNSVLDLI